MITGQQTSGVVASGVHRAARRSSRGATVRTVVLAASILAAYVVVLDWRWITAWGHALLHR